MLRPRPPGDPDEGRTAAVGETGSAVQSSSTTTCAGSTGSVTIAALTVGGTVLIAHPTPIAPNTAINVGW
jgi:hypothetical protein